MKNLKILCSFLLLTLLCLISYPFSAHAAEVTTYDDTNQYYFTTTENIENNMYGATWNKVSGKTATGEQSVNLFSMKTDGVSSKLVVWSTQYQNFRNNRTTLTKLAENYEKNHPGWKVVAGINADQYILSFGTETISKGQDFYEWQPYYPIIMDGERRFPYSMTANSSNAIAFTNDGSTNGFIDVNNVQGLYLEILDDNDNVLSKHPVEGVNQSPSANTTTVWFSYVNSSKEYEALNVTSTNNLYIVSKAELAYMNNSRTYTYKGQYAIDSVFGRGTIDQITQSFTLDKGQFIIDSNDTTLTSLLDTGVRIRVQFSYANEALNNVEAASGYHTIQRLNGTDMGVSGSYNTSTYSRSVFGIKADGTYILMTADMTTNKKISGLNGWEINAFLKQNNVVTAYQDDGGGSVTAIWRNKDGGFDLVNTPRDGSERSNLSGLFFVVKDSGLKIDSIEATSNSLTLNVNTDEADMTKIQKIYCTINNVTKEVINNKVTFDGLEKMTNYTYSFSYDTNNSKGVDAILNGTTSTVKTLPTIKDWEIELKDNKVIFNPIIEDVDLAFDYIRVIVDGERYPYLDEPIEITIDSSLEMLNYTLTYSYNLYGPNDTEHKVTFEENKVLNLKNEEPSDSITPDNPSIPDDSNDSANNPQQGCKKNLSILVVSLISLSTVFVFIKKRQ